MIQFGIHSHLFRGSPAVVAEACRRLGLDCVQLTPGFPGLPFHEPGLITPTRCRQAAQPFLDVGLHIACLSGNTDLMNPDLERRHRGIVRLHCLLRHGRDFGTDRVVTETGTLSPRSSLEPHAPDHSREAWDELRLIVLEALHVAADHGVMLLLKPVPGHVLGSPGEAVRLHEELLHPRLGFILDPANAVLTQDCLALKETLERVVEQLAPLAPIVHAKDVAVEGASVATPRAGKGILDYAHFFRLLRHHQPGASVILEHLRPEEVSEARMFMDRALSHSE
jgi:sugar phosphate isomerase/epimerase